MVLPDPLGPITATLSAGPKWPETSSKMRFVWSLPVFTSRVMPVNLTCTGVAAEAASTSSMAWQLFWPASVIAAMARRENRSALKMRIGSYCCVNMGPMAVTNCVSNRTEPAKLEAACYNASVLHVASRAA